MSASNTISTAERRRAARFRPAFGTYCRCLCGGEGLVWDMSATGLGMLIVRPLAVGEMIRVELTSLCTSLSVPARVVHARRLAGGDFFVGLQFARSLARHELYPFVGHALSLPDAGWPAVEPLQG